MVQEVFRQATADDVYKRVRSFLAGHIKSKGSLKKGAEVPVKMKYAVFLKHMPSPTEDVIVDIPSKGEKKNKQYCFRFLACDEKKLTATFKIRKVECY